MMKIVPEQTIQEILIENSLSKLILENLGINADVETTRTLIDISEERLIPLDCLIEDLSLALNHSH